MKHSTGNRTKAEQARFNKIKDMGLCMACYQDGNKEPQYVEIHHFLSGNKRIGHMATAGLCEWHHRGATDFGLHFIDYTEAYGPSLANGSKPFRARYGTDKELLALQNALLEGTDGA
jgi:hypothetical protein